jgi:two-component system LytT family response regulator
MINRITIVNVQSILVQNKLNENEKEKDMLKCIIVDDQDRDRQNLRMLLQTYCPDVEVLAEASDSDSLQDVLSYCEPNIIFLDIQIGKSTCFDILDDLDINTHNFKIIFVTGSEDYAIKGYSYNGIDYILKPILPEKLIKVVHKAKQLSLSELSNKGAQLNADELHVGSQKSSKIHIRDGKNVYFYNASDVLCFIGGRNYTTVKLVGNKEIVTIQKLKEFEVQLVNTTFFRVHRSYVVNLSHITSLSRDEGCSVFLGENIQVPVSKNYKKQLIAKIQMQD